MVSGLEEDAYQEQAERCSPVDSHKATMNHVLPARANENGPGLELFLASPSWVH